MGNSLFDMSSEDFLAALPELAQLGEDTSDLMRRYREHNNPLTETVTNYEEGLAAEGRRPVAGGVLSKPEGATGWDAIRGLRPEFKGGAASVGAEVFNAAEAPSAAARGLIPGEDMTMEALGTAGFAASGTLAATRPSFDANTTSMFGARGIPEDARATASQMKERGVDDGVIWEDQGVEFNQVNREWEREFDSTQMVLRDPDAPQKTEKEVSSELFQEANEMADLHGTSGQESVKFKYIADFPDLFEAYPEIADTDITFRPGRGAEYNPDDRVVTVGMETLQDPDTLKLTLDNFKSVLVHELQHAVQDIDGAYSRGGNSTYILRTVPHLREAMDNAEAARTEGGFLPRGVEDSLKTLGDESPYHSEFGKEYAESFQDDRLYDIRMAEHNAKREAFRRYQALEGEVQSRGAEARRELSAQERLETPPSQTYREVISRDQDSLRSPNLESVGRVGYAEGGLVSKNAMSDYFMASSGRMTEMEFTGKHKMSTLEFERQFQEDNNVDITGTESLAEVNTKPKGNTMPIKDHVQGYAVGGPVKRDPVSGNHIPPGSSPENVRDDIPAMLSEGEYVVPADVLKYFGVNFFEELRMKAKEGMMSMEQDGRIDGDPVMPQMAKGGLVAEQGTFNPNDWSTVGLGGKGLGSSAYEYKEFVGPAGDIQMILFVNGSAAQNIPNGYRDSSLPAATARTSGGGTSQPARNNNDRDQSINQAQRNKMALGDVGTGSGTSFGNPLGDLDFTDPDSIQEWADNKLSENWINKGARVAGGILGGAIAGPMGSGIGSKGANTALELRNIAEVNAAAMYYKNLGNNEMADNLFTQAKAWGEEYGFMGEQGAEAFATGEGIYNSYRDSLGGNPVSVSSQRRDTSAGLDVARQLNADAGQSYADTGTARSTSWDGGQVVTQSNPNRNSGNGHTNAAQDAADARSRAQSAADRDGYEMATGGRNKGGLVTRPKK